MAWQKLNSKTLSGTANEITTDVFTAKKFIQGLSHTLGSGATNEEIRVGTGSIDTGTNYAYRQQYNGGADGTAINATYIHMINNTGNDAFIVYYLINISGEEKLLMGWLNNGNTAGAGNAPERMETVGKWITTTQVDILETTDTSASTFATDSNLTAIGTD